MSATTSSDAAERAPRADAKRNRETLLVCAGQAFGSTEAILCLATLAQRVRLRLVPLTIVEPVARLSLRPANGLPMLIERRA